MNRYVVAISGASGSIIGLKLVEALLTSNEVHIVISQEGISIMKSEVGLDWSNDRVQKIRDYFKSDRIFSHDYNDFYSPIASGSFQTSGMFVVPCSVKTLSGIANGYGQSLIERAADVTIKEGRKLLLSPREMPFSAIHLENMLKLARLGVIIAPAVPAFYQAPLSLDDIISFFCGKMLDSFGISHELYRRWTGVDC